METDENQQINRDQPMMMMEEQDGGGAVVNEEDDLDVDDTPAFIDPEDAVEVLVDDENVPMDDDDDDDDDENEVMDQDGASRQVVDMSKVKVEAHSGPVYAVACHSISKEELCIISGGGDDKAFLHKLTSTVNATTAPAPLSKSFIPLSEQHTDSVSCVALNLPYVTDDLQKTPKYAAVGSFDGTIVVYDPETGQKIQKFEGPSDVEWLTFHPKGGSVILAGSSTDATVWMFHVPLNKCLQVFVGHESSVSCGAFSPDGRWALSGSSDGTVRLWAPRTGASKHVFRLGSNNSISGITCMAIGGGADEQLVLVGAEDGQAHVCHIGNKKVVASVRHYDVLAGLRDEETLELPMSVEAVGFSSVNPNWCATGGVDGVLKIWDLSNGQCRQVCQPPIVSSDAEKSVGGGGGGITRLQWHPTLPLVFTSSTNGSICVWDARNGKLLHTLTGNADVVNDMAISFNSESGNAIIVTGGEDHQVRVFELDSTALLNGSAL